MAILSMSCSEQQPPGVNYAVLDDLFQNYSPRYNYTTEPTMMLAHSSQVVAEGFENLYEDYSYKII